MAGKCQYLKKCSKPLKIKTKAGHRWPIYFSEHKTVFYVYYIMNYIKCKT